MIDLLLQGKTPKEAAAILKLKNETVTESRLRRARYVTDSKTTVQLIYKLCQAAVLLFCVTTPCFAGEVWVLTKTNLAEFAAGHVLMDGTNIIFFPKGTIERKGCVELSTYTLIATNWSDGAILEVDGVKRVTQVGNLITNRTLHVDFEGKNYMVPISQTLGPKVAERSFDVPLPVTPPLPLRQNR